MIGEDWWLTGKQKGHLADWVGALFKCEATKYQFAGLGFET